MAVKFNPVRIFVTRKKICFESGKKDVLVKQPLLSLKISYFGLLTIKEENNINDNKTRQVEHFYPESSNTRERGASKHNSQ